MTSSELNTFCKKREEPCNEHICGDGSCRMSTKGCGSRHVCPPGYRKCADGLCVDRHINCSNNSPVVVATPLTCANSSHVVCPDNTCRPSEFQCNFP